MGPLVKHYAAYFVLAHVLIGFWWRLHDIVQLELGADKNENAYYWIDYLITHPRSHGYSGKHSSKQEGTQLLLVYFLIGNFNDTDRSHASSATYFRTPKH